MILKPECFCNGLVWIRHLTHDVLKYVVNVWRSFATNTSKERFMHCANVLMFLFFQFSLSQRFLLHSLLMFYKYFSSVVRCKHWFDVSSDTEYQNTFPVRISEKGRVVRSDFRSKKKHLVSQNKLSRHILRRRAKRYSPYLLLYTRVSATSCELIKINSKFTGPINE